MDKMLRVNLTELTVKEEPFPEEWRFLGGRALSAKILLKEMDPKCDPLGPGNKVIFAPGVLSGSAAPTSGRMSVGAKSPLTGGIKEANSGGQAGQKLARLGYRAIIVEGKAKDAAQRHLLVIKKDGVTMRECPELKGLRTYTASEKLYDQFSGRAAFVLCGPAGELGFSGASVAFTDEGKRHPSRHAARGGLGAAMGAKGLKGIVQDARRQDEQGVHGRRAALPVRHIDDRAARQHDEHPPDTQPP
jgi:aldehyde:ferredoxin oxidoreductase